MRLAIVRHGKAHASSDTGRDRDRTLTGRGERQAKWLGLQFASGDHAPELILSSPYERAISTARLIQPSLGVVLETVPELACDEPVSGIIGLIERHRPHRSLMIVGHNPVLSQLVGVLIGGPANTRVELRTGEAAIVDVEGDELIGAGTLVQTMRLEED